MKDNIKELTEGMQRLCAIANRIVGRPEEVSRIEKDLLLEDLRRLYDVALRLCDEGEEVCETGKERNEMVPEAEMPDEEMLSSTVMATMAAMGVAEPAAPEVVPELEPEPAPEPEPVVVPEPEPEPEHAPAPEAPVAEMPKMEELEAHGNSLLFDEVIIEPETPVVSESPKTPEAPEPSVVPETPAPEPESASKAGVQASLLDYLHSPQSHRGNSPSLVEQLKPSVRTLGEKLGGVENGEPRMESGIDAGKKVSDLRTVININDKFSFMSELFHNNMKAYNDFILRLNSIDTRDEALLCVNEVSAQYKWDDSSLAVQSFFKVFDKKF